MKAQKSTAVFSFDFVAAKHAAKKRKNKPAAMTAEKRKSKRSK